LGGIEVARTFERGGDLAARGETVLIVEARGAAGSGGGVHEGATALALRWLLLLLPGGGDGDAARAEGERPLVACRVGKEKKKPLAFCLVYF
jgi:hypothetical protein